MPEVSRRADALFELAEAVLCAGGPVRTLAGLSLAPEHQRGHGALYDAVNCGRVVRSHTARGVRFRRARVVSEPLAPFIRFEYEVTAAVSVAAESKSGGCPAGAEWICACP